MPALEPMGVFNLGGAPGPVSNLMAWWRADDLLGTFADGASITSVPDASGHSRTLTPYNALKPIFKTGIQNGLPAIRFAGSTDVMKFTTTGALSDWTIILVAGGLDVATNAINYAIGQTGAGTIIGGNNSTYGFLGELQDTSNLRMTSVKPTGWGVDIWTPAAIYRDGTVVASTLTGSLTRFDLTDIGGRNDAANLGITGDVGEILIYNTSLSTGDRAAVQAYLKARWNTP